jgi:hypothetical protein
MGVPDMEMAQAGACAKIFTLYIQNIKLDGVKWPKFLIFLLEWNQWDRGNWGWFGGLTRRDSKWEWGG